MSVEDVVARLCVWKNSMSLVPANPFYARCVGGECSGYNKSCTYYLAKQDYFLAKLEACKRLNEKNKGGDVEGV